MRSTSVRFVDTNVLIYAISDDPEESEKAAIANDLLEQPDLALSVQVLQEFYVQTTRHSRRHPVHHDQAVRFARSLRRFPVQELTVAIVEAAFATRHRWRISYWDAAILEAARTLGCTLVLSEDLSDETDYGGIRVRNPFRTTAEV